MSLLNKAGLLSVGFVLLGACAGAGCGSAPPLVEEFVPATSQRLCGHCLLERDGELYCWNDQGAVESIRHAWQDNAELRDVAPFVQVVGHDGWCYARTEEAEVFRLYDSAHYQPVEYPAQAIALLDLGFLFQGEDGLMLETIGEPGWNEPRHKVLGSRVDQVLAVGDVACWSAAGLLRCGQCLGPWEPRELTWVGGVTDFFVDYYSPGYKTWSWDEPAPFEGNFRRLFRTWALVCAVHDGGLLSCNDAQLGYPSAEVDRTPDAIVEVDGTLVDDAVRIIVGNYTDVHHRSACFTRRDGSVWCWGSDLHAELGMGVSSPVLQPYPIRVPLANDSPVVELSTFGRGGTCALHEDDSVSCWGRCREELVDRVASEIRYYDCVAPYNLSPREDWLAAQP